MQPFIQYDYNSLDSRTFITFTWDEASILIPLKNASTSFQHTFRVLYNMAPAPSPLVIDESGRAKQQFLEWWKHENKYIILREPLERFNSGLQTAGGPSNSFNFFERVWFDHMGPVYTPLRHEMGRHGIMPGEIKAIHWAALGNFIDIQKNETNWRQEEQLNSPHYFALKNMNTEVIEREKESYDWFMNNCKIAGAIEWKQMTQRLLEKEQARAKPDPRDEETLRKQEEGKIKFERLAEEELLQRQEADKFKQERLAEELRLQKLKRNSGV